MKCPVCDNDKWKNVDKYRLKPKGMHMCETCGFVSYPEKFQTKEEVIEFYRKEYRPAPNVTNLYTGERKLHYHEAFAGPLFESWKKQGKTKPIVGEVGAAYGVFLNWLKTYHFPEGEFYGTELTKTYRRVAFHEYGLNLTEDLPKKEYDMICSYHVLEHQCEPDKELQLYASMLKEDGFIYLSTPIWFREATNFGGAGFDIEDYWAPAHINCWSVSHLETIIAKAGLVIVQRNDDIYGNTYLLQKAKGTIEYKVEWKPERNLEAIERIWRCWQALQENETNVALEAWPNCPTAWVNHYELNRNPMHKLGFEKIHEFLERAMKTCPNQADCFTLAGDVCARYENYDLSLKYFQEALSRKPNNPTILMGIGNCFRQKANKAKDPEEKIKWLKESIAVCKFIQKTSMEVMPTATTFTYADCSQIPTPWE